MSAFRKLRFLAIVFVLVAVFAGAFTTMTAQQVDAAKCCWVRVCMTYPPYSCWDECVPCPPLFP
jgi:hypothetical protein